jgi:hypothetical protein
MSGVMMPILGYLKVTNFNEELDVCNGVANKTLKHILSLFCFRAKSLFFQENSRQENRFFC